MKAIILHDIRSAQNVGSIFRTADAVGISKIYLSAITPSPVDRFGRARTDIAKTALGAEKTIPFEHYKTLPELIELLKKEGCTIYAVEQSGASTDYKSVVEVPEHTALIFGNEVGGIPQEILSLVDHTLEIPMRGKKESLNVSVSAGIILFRLFDQ